MSEKSIKDEYIEKFKSIYGDKYDYSKINYQYWNIPVTIICKKHGLFEKTLIQHIDGQECNVCEYLETGKTYYYNTKIFTLKAIEVHGDLYDYSDVNYTNSKTHVKINCKKHGPFYQQPNAHIQGSGCPKCAGHGPKYTGWTLESYKKAAKASSHFTGFYFYISKIEDECGIYFYKVGITFTSPKKRMYALPYTNIEILYIIKYSTAAEVWKFEDKAQKLCKDFQYFPNLDFGGKTECFTSIDPIRPLLIEEFLTKKSE